MSAKGSTTLADVIEWEDIGKMYDSCVKTKKYDMAAIIVAGSYLGLSYRDAIRLTWADVLTRNSVVFTYESKKPIYVSNEAYKKFMELFSCFRDTDMKSPIFYNRRGSVSTIQVFNKKCKWLNSVVKFKYKNITTHSFRKSFGRHLYDELPITQKRRGLEILADYFGHANTKLTEDYICAPPIPKSNLRNISEVVALVNHEELPVGFDKLIECNRCPDVDDYCVYIFRDNKKQGYVKIGKAKDLLGREGNLATGNPDASMYCFLPRDSEADAFTLETMLHRRYRKLCMHIKGEWFCLPDGILLDLINEFPWVFVNGLNKEQELKKLSAGV